VDIKKIWNFEFVEQGQKNKKKKEKPLENVNNHLDFC